MRTSRDLQRDFQRELKMNLKREFKHEIIENIRAYGAFIWRKRRKKGRLTNLSQLEFDYGGLNWNFGLNNFITFY